MDVTCLMITPDGLKPVNRSEVRFDLDAMPRHKRESFLLSQLDLIRKWSASQETQGGDSRVAG